MSTLKFHTRVMHRWYKSEIIVGGWLTANFYGPFHRHRAEEVVKKCQLEAAKIIAKEALAGKNIYRIYH